MNQNVQYDSDFVETVDRKHQVGSIISNYKEKHVQFPFFNMQNVERVMNQVMNQGNEPEMKSYCTEEHYKCFMYVIL